ncbi:MAG TPA: four helix bundle protein [Thermoanaerobaculia bacterium]
MTARSGNEGSGPRPEYKSHPLWGRAIAITREAYALAEDLRSRDAAAARSLRRAAVAIPARVAGALESRGRRRAEEVLAARGALAEVARQARIDDSAAARRLQDEAADLDARVLFDLAPLPGPVS